MKGGGWKLKWTSVSLFRIVPPRIDSWMHCHPDLTPSDHTSQYSTQFKSGTAIPSPRVFGVASARRYSHADRNDKQNRTCVRKSGTTSRTTGRAPAQSTSKSVFAKLARSYCDVRLGQQGRRSEISATGLSPNASRPAFNYIELINHVLIRSLVIPFPNRFFPCHSTAMRTTRSWITFSTGTVAKKQLVLLK